jgi:hypothetical protein
VALTVDCQQLRHREWNSAVAWANITNITSKDEAFRGKVLTVHVQAPGSGADKLKIPLRKLAGKEQASAAVVGRYYGRYRAAKAYLDKAEAAPKT